MKILLFVLPIVLLLAWSLLLEVLSGMINNFYLRVCLLTLGSLLAGFGMLVVIRLLANKAKLELPRIGTWRELIIGLGIGILVSSFSAGSYYLINKPQLNFEVSSSKFINRFTRNVSPAVLEEVSFRGSIVHYSRVLWGKNVALATGSIPFGLLHNINKLFGQPVSILQILGICAAGLLLSLCYLKFGLLNAIAVHWMWNGLIGTWITVLNLPRNGGVQILEGAWSTTLILVLVSLYINFTFSSEPIS